ncbi:MAG TPA: cell wall hydrolase, partial [Candidatus Paceibacterota bacterium]
MVHKLRYILQDISHRGAHIGRDIEINIKTSENMSLNFKQNVLPDNTTEIGKTLGVVEVKEDVISVLLDITIIEHDKLFNDVGNQSQKIIFDTRKDTAIINTIIVAVSERRWFFWKEKAYFTLTFVTKIETESGAPVPTVDNPKWTGNFRDDTDQMILARILFAEMRNTLIPDKARYAVASVIRNRVNDTRWANSYVEVIIKDKQFSALNEG